MSQLRVERLPPVVDVEGAVEVGACQDGDRRERERDEGSGPALLDPAALDREHEDHDDGGEQEQPPNRPTSSRERWIEATGAARICGGPSHGHAGDALEFHLALFEFPLEPGDTEKMGRED